MDFACSKSCPSLNSEDVWMKMLGGFKWLIVVISSLRLGGKGDRSPLCPTLRIFLAWNEHSVSRAHYAP